MNYTRKRAIVACDFCRHRKRKCDGQRPCSTCRDSKADCVYKDLVQDKIEDASPNAVIERLSRIETLLEQQRQRLDLMSISSTPVPLQSTQPNYFSGSEYLQVPDFHDATIDVQPENVQFLLPKNHATAANTLLSFPFVRELLGDYSRDFFFNVEADKPLPGLLTGREIRRPNYASLQASVLDSLAQSYFTHVHPHHPIFSRQDFQVWHGHLLQKRLLDDFEEDIETVICLCVYALGAIAGPLAADEDEEEDGPADFQGLHYFEPGLRICLHHVIWNFRPNLEICCGLILVSSYLAHMGRPLHSWKMCLWASQEFLSLVDSEQLQAGYREYTDREVRVFWQLFMIECDRAAELDIPRSGIEPLGDKMVLPHSIDPSEDHTTMSFIAEIAIRKLLNVIHNFLYNPESADTSLGIPPEPHETWRTLRLQKLLNITSELNRQLEDWYISLPDSIQPPKGTVPLAGDRSRVLRIRYYSARQIIYRPFIFQTVVRHQASIPTTAGSSSEYAGVPPIVLEKCEMCIESCLNYLSNAVEMLDKGTPYLWTLAQNCMASMVILMLAHRCPPLRRFVPDMRHMQSLLLRRLQKWATKDSSFGTEMEIIGKITWPDHMST